MKQKKIKTQEMNTRTTNSSTIAVHCSHKELVDVVNLQPHPRNPNKHGDKQVALLAKIIRHQGWRSPIVVSKRSGYIVAGHGRLQAAQLLQVESVPVDYQDFATEADEYAHLVADNRIAELAEIDEAELAVILKELDGKIDMDLTGFDADALTELDGFAEECAVDSDPQVGRAEELRVKWGVETGQLWKLGEHRLICGDCTDKEVVERVMGGERASLAPVDPPYNVGFDYDGKTVDDTKNHETYEAFSRAWFSICQSVSDRQIVTPGCYNLALWLRWFDPLHWAPWTKSNSMTNGRVSRFWCWEPVLFFGDKWKRIRSNDIFDYPIGKQEGVANHPCPKPLKMWIDIIENYSEPNDIILESFNGSGTTIIACEQLGRKCRAIEISPAYVAVALQRWSDATGKTPGLIK